MQPGPTKTKNGQNKALSNIWQDLKNFVLFILIFLLEQPTLFTVRSVG